MLSTHTPTSVIYDADMGGDDLWAIAVLSSLVKSGHINLLGMSACFGNTNVAQATRNALDFMDYISMAPVPVYQGCERPISGLDPLLDGAYGSNGLSNAALPSSSLQPQSGHATDWLADQLLNADEKITVICTGPLTNIATVYQNHPELDGKGHEIIWLGGSLSPAGKNHMPTILPNGQIKKGNITNFSEFNAINDPVAAQIIADLEQTKVTIAPLDATQDMVVGFTQGTSFMRDMAGKEAIAANLLSMLDDAAILDQNKFDVLGAFLHDPQVVMRLLNTDLFLPAVPVKDVTFINQHQLAKDFDAVACGFDFSLLGNHGEMNATPTKDASNKFIIPGLTSFNDAATVDKTVIESMEKLSQERYIALTKQVVLGIV